MKNNRPESETAHRTEPGQHQDRQQAQGRPAGPFRRILALLLLCVIIALFAALLYFAATGAPAETILSILFCLIVIPCLIYAFRLCVRFMSKKR